jgi:general secretion pathway protein J
VTARATHHRVLARVAGEGFTLVEVMVALTILSLVMLATVTGLRTLANTQVAIERQTDRVDELRTVSSFLRDTMESALVGSESGGLGLGGGGRGSGYFEMTDDALSWKTTIQFGESFGGSYLVRVAKENDMLVLRWQEETVGGATLEWDQAQQRVLVDDVQDFELSWRRSYQGDWLAQWEKGDIPGWVRLQVQASGRYWPELIMQVPN